MRPTRCEHCGGPLFRKRHISQPRIGEVAFAWDGYDTNRGGRCRICGVESWSSAEVMHGYNTRRRATGDVWVIAEGNSTEQTPATSTWLPGADVGYCMSHQERLDLISTLYGALLALPGGRWVNVHATSPPARFTPRPDSSGTASARAASAAKVLRAISARLLRDRAAAVVGYVAEVAA